ncbi:uncharacterized protein PHACADRAFT_101677 [Phanerochaete carnosa HHB-10118-sp]|uniref:F-box domain-containing protein n=1 Tax=Phanerochaete carnosa (strain HHB-10118-sp) TaxID=650164 RepID=K5VKK6_PHACS|nr:uncharacterized protein PHACADRAFT_101677 [Phanerochaete carnosa HHB-10118-sp]EKM51923.1 hypothetical protein PHACADRAFT_101677 [Phanerochaete carnosa HHB-10118-sp]
MAAWEGQIVAAKRRLNELTPIGRLPSEMLAETFLHRSAGWSTGDQSWIEVSHVCHRWREIALDCPALWGHIYTHTSAWTRELLLRSKQAALDVIISENDEINREDIIHLLVHHLHRMRSINWGLYYNPLDGSDLPRVAPFLRSVTLHNDELDEYGPSTTPFDKIEALPLTHLELVCAPVSWTSNLFRPTLTHLTFRLPSDFPQPVDCNMSEVLGLLRSMPSLQILELANVLPDAGRARVGPDAYVHFTQLRLLNIEASAATMRYFLEHVSFSKDAEITIEYSDLELDHENMEQSMRLLASRFASDSRSKNPVRPLQSLYCARNVAEAWTIDRGLEALSQKHARNAAATKLLQGVHHTLAVRAVDLPFEHSGAFFEMFCRSLPLAETSSAFIDIEGMGDTQWRSAYQSMPHLRELGVTGSSSCHTSLIDLLATVLAATDGALCPSHSNLPVYMFPKLEVLLIRGLHLPLASTDNLGSRGHHLLDTYAKVLRDRSDAGHQLSSLVLVGGSNILQQDVDKFLGTVKEVHCDCISTETSLGPIHMSIPSLTLDDKVRLFVVRPGSRR